MTTVCFDKVGGSLIAVISDDGVQGTAVWSPGGGWSLADRTPYIQGHSWGCLMDPLGVAIRKLHPETFSDWNIAHNAVLNWEWDDSSVDQSDEDVGEYELSRMYVVRPLEGDPFTGGKVVRPELTPDRDLTPDRITDEEVQFFREYTSDDLFPDEVMAAEDLFMMQVARGERALPKDPWKRSLFAASAEAALDHELDSEMLSDDEYMRFWVILKKAARITTQKLDVARGLVPA